MGKQSLRYRCENEFGADPCEIAKKGTLLNEADVGPSMDGGPPACPGKTESGKACGQPLVVIGGIKKKGGGETLGGLPWKLIGAVAAAILVILGLVFVIPRMFPENPKLVVETDPVVFVRGQDGAETGSLRIKNAGDEELVVSRIAASPAVFAPDRTEATLKPGKTRAIVIKIQASSPDRQGEVVLETNDPKAKRVSVRLDAGNQASPPVPPVPPQKDPWGVVDEINSTATHLD